MSVILYNKKEKKLEYIDLTDAMVQMYELRYKVPTEEEVEEYLNGKNKNSEIKSFFGKNISSGIKKIKKTLSKIDNKIPMYDVYSENLYLVDRKNIYNKVMFESYRFPSEDLLINLKHSMVDLEERILTLQHESADAKKQLEKKSITEIDQNLSSTLILEISLTEQHRKIGLCLEFMDFFILPTLFNTYVNALYTYSTEIGKNLTLCRRPSFAYQLKIQPYYTKAEIINIALNDGIIKSEKEFEDNDINVKKLCQQVSSNDVNYQVLLDHQLHIIQNKMIGLVQYYSLQGSYFMNQYLRGQSSYAYRNEYLESLIKPMWKLVNSAPKFDKTYILYRFVQTDEFISHLKVGETFIEKGFMSTTRDPFYQNDQYKFGWILLKIRLPANISGCALCIETISQFPKEEEIILAPNTQFKLIRRDDKTIYYHTDKAIGKKLKGTYEFEVVGTSPITFQDRPEYKMSENPIDFMKIQRTDALTIEEKIHSFINKYVNAMGNFVALIGEKQFVVKSEFYDSSSVYKDYYAHTTHNGYSLYSIHNNHLLFIIEIGEKQGMPIISVNYHIKYSTLEHDKIISSDGFMMFIASVSYYFDIQNVVVYADYVSCDYLSPIDDDHKYTKFYGGTYCVDFYEYLKYGKKKYSEIGLSNIELIPKFKYHQLDILRKTKPEDILEKFNERDTYDRVYQIYAKSYKPSVSEVNDTLANFYVWFSENSCYLLDTLISKFSKIGQYTNDNPFQNDYYIFNALGYLYNRGHIQTMPMSINDKTIRSLPMKTKSDSMNRYRLMDDKQRRR